MFPYPVLIYRTVLRFLPFHVFSHQPLLNLNPVILFQYFQVLLELLDFLQTSHILRLKLLIRLVIIDIEILILFIDLVQFLYFVLMVVQKQRIFLSQVDHFVHTIYLLIYRIEFLYAINILLQLFFLTGNLLQQIFFLVDKLFLYFAVFFNLLTLVLLFGLVHVCNQTQIVRLIHLLGYIVQLATA